MTKTGKYRQVHLTGSIPLESADDVFALVGAELGDLCIRIPDGETGSRKNWIGWQYSVFARQEALVQKKERDRAYQLHPPFVFKDGSGAADLDFSGLGFAEEALQSYSLFSARRAAGVLPPQSRFLVALPTPFALVYSFTGYTIQEEVYAVYEAAILVELNDLCRVIPHEHLAIQWDVATEMSIFEKVYQAPLSDAWKTLNDRLVYLGNQVPSDVELGYHLCYGSMNNRHWKEPDDLGMCVAVINRIVDQISRNVQFWHVPVPVDRDDDAYFSPLSQLQIGTGCDLFLGLIHDSDDLKSNRARMDAAAKYYSDFGIAAECGLGRRKSEDVAAIIRLHGEIAKGVPV